MEVEQVEDLLLELLQEDAHVHPPLGVQDVDLKKHTREEIQECAV